MLEIKTFGGLSIQLNRQVLAGLGSRKVEAILLYLAVGQAPCNREVLAALLWPDVSTSQAQTSLRVALSGLKKHLGDYIDISRQSVELKPDAQVYVDAVDLQTRLQIGQIDQALEIYQGEFLGGFSLKDCLEFDDWQRMHQEKIHRSMVNALHTAVNRAIETADYRQGQVYARRLIELNPLDELAYRKSMLLYAREGDQALALQLYRQCQAALRIELDLDPSPETQSLSDQISKGTVPPPDALLTPPLVLPSPQTSFIDREEELEQIISLVGNPVCRLLSLTGPGWIGKSRLAIAAADHCYPFFPDGIYFVPLESVASPEYLVHAVADVLKFKIDTIATQLEAKYQLFDYLRKRSILLVMDGFEHLVSGSGLLADLLNHAPRLKALVTTRQRLNLKGEWVFPVGGLPIPGEAGEEAPVEAGALQLFFERARQANVHFIPSDMDHGHALQICRLLDGMPLGIELAAAWTSTLSPGEIARQIQNSLDFLSAPWQDAEQKHHSLRAAFDSSWERLSEDLRTAFGRLTVFQGGFDPQAAMGVAGISIEQLSRLLDRSMLYRDDGGRFSMHRLLMEFGTEKVQESPTAWEEIQACHCLYYTALLETRRQDLLGARMYTAAAEVRQEMGNIRKAVNWAVAHWEPDKVRPVLMGLLAFYCLQGWHEGKDAFNEIAQARKNHLMSGDDSLWMEDPIYLCASTHQAFLLCNLGQVDENDLVSRACLEPLRAHGLTEELSECIHNLGVNASFRGEYQPAIELLQEAIQLGHDSQNPLWPTYLLWYGHAYFLLGEYSRGMESLQKCYELFQRSGNSWGMAFAMSKMGLAADGLGEFHQARQYHHRALLIFEDNGNQAGKGYALSRMSMSEYFLGNYTQAVRLGDEGYQVFHPLGHHWGICTSLCRLGFGYIGLGDFEKAEGCFREALEKSRQYRMIPLSLYALAGLAVTMYHAQGEKKTGAELFSYVRSQPQIPAIYIQQAKRWIAQQHIPVMPGGKDAAGLGTDSLDNIIDRVLNLSFHAIQSGVDAQD